MADAAKERRHEARHSPAARGGDPVSSVVQEIPPDVLAVLALPPLDGLTDDQRRGATCVWHDGKRLTGEKAVALGEHMSPLRGSTTPTRWFPRACHTCVADRAHHSLFAHCTTCKDCADEAGRCEIGRGLYRLVRQYRR
ncbi:hypothetical protein [Streptomyces sp. NPDC047009]|uniref:hypothetical protein n=1 Tax=unclassified Streptomyces TaxID=2593676 RepID=UPI0033F6B766